jgi:hypothetical protein
MVTLVITLSLTYVFRKLVPIEVYLVIAKQESDSSYGEP